MSALPTFQPSPILLPAASFSFDPADAAAAVIVIEGEGEPERFLLQHRDRIAGILYPGFWGCFGGARDGSETAEQALRRELKEELRLDFGGADYFTAVNYDFRFCGKGVTLREYYVVRIAAATLDTLELGEGQAMATFGPTEVFALRDIIPFDLWAIWLYVHREALTK